MAKQITEKQLEANRKNIALANANRDTKGEKHWNWKGGRVQRLKIPCPQCGKERYTTLANTKANANSICMECYRNREKTFDYKACRKKIYAANKEFAFKYKGAKCERCGVDNLPTCCYHFHHKDRRDKTFGIAQSFGIRITDKVIKELDKCLLLCANCHAIMHWSNWAKNGGNSAKTDK